MTTREEKLLLAKERLCTALGEENTQIYMSNLKTWFRKVWTKEQFDFKCRKLFTPEQKHLHNEFFIAILNKITTPWHIPNENEDLAEINEMKEVDEMRDMDSIDVGEFDEMDEKSDIREKSNKEVNLKKRKKMLKPVDPMTFKPVQLCDYLSEEDPDLLLPLIRLPQAQFAAHEICLPDFSMMMGRIFVGAWEHGLLSAEDKTCYLIVDAVKIFLKNILTAIIKDKKHYSVTNNGNFSYDFGQILKHPFTLNTVTRQIIDDIPYDIDSEIRSTKVSRRTRDNAVFLADCENVYQSPLKKYITASRVYNALQDKNVIPCHSIYAPNIEKVTNLLE